MGPLPAVLGAISAGKGLYDQFKPAAKKGREDKARLDATYPGTSPWEQLGAGGAGVAGAQASSSGARAQERMAQRANAAQIRSTTISSVASMLQSAISDNPAAVDRFLELFGEVSGAPVRAAGATGGHVQGEPLMSGQARDTAETRFRTGVGAGHISREVVGAANLPAALARDAGGLRDLIRSALGNREATSVGGRQPAFDGVEIPSEEILNGLAMLLAGGAGGMALRRVLPGLRRMLSRNRLRRSRPRIGRPRGDRMPISQAQEDDMVREHSRKYGS